VGADVDCDHRAEHELLSPASVGWTTVVHPEDLEEVTFDLDPELVVPISMLGADGCARHLQPCRRQGDHLWAGAGVGADVDCDQTFALRELNLCVRDDQLVATTMADRVAKLELAAEHPGRDLERLARQLVLGSVRRNSYPCAAVLPSVEMALPEAMALIDPRELNKRDRHTGDAGCVDGTPQMRDIVGPGGPDVRELLRALNAGAGVGVAVAPDDHLAILRHDAGDAVVDGRHAFLDLERPGLRGFLQYAAPCGTRLRDFYDHAISRGARPRP